MIVKCLKQVFLCKEVFLIEMPSVFSEEKSKIQDKILLYSVSNYDLNQQEYSKKSKFLSFYLV